MLAIHASDAGFHPRWASYCCSNQIPYRTVNCYESDIVAQLKGCDALMWHHSHSNPRDMLIAKQIMFALQHSGFEVFPDFRTAWHFDDKVAQKYLFEALDLSAVPAWVFTDKKEALGWIARTTFPKVFKLRRGAGSSNVRLVKSRSEAQALTRRAFSKGISTYDPWTSLKERMYKKRIGKAGWGDVMKGIARFTKPPGFSSVVGKECGYVYFQEFIPGNDSDTRVIVIGERAFAIKRLTRPGDFRASGSGKILHDAGEIDEACVKAAFDINSKVLSDCLACDFVLSDSGAPLLIEISYGFDQKGYESCPGYWTEDMSFHRETFDPQGWMVESILG